jgi:succinyl-CoA:acetate CoA-transferase
MLEQVKERIKYEPLRGRLVTAEEAAGLVKDGMRIGTCGTMTAGYPVSFFEALAQRGEKGDKFKIDLWSCAPLGPEVDGRLAETGLLNRRLAHQANPALAKAINKGEIHYADMGAAWVPLEVRKGSLGKLDLAVIEAVEITDEGFVVPTINVGDEATFLRYADEVIVEINVNLPLELTGIHDIYIPDSPPNRKPIPLNSVTDRIGTPYIEVDPEKIKGIIISDKTTTPPKRAAIDETSRKIAQNIVNFFEKEVEKGKLPQNLLPFQTGLGAIGGAILSELEQSKFENLLVHSALLDDGVLDLIDSGKIKAASGVGLFFTSEALQKFFSDVKRYKEKIILRPIDIVNAPEVIRRLGVIAFNTAIEIDIYGHINSSHVGGTRIVTGVAGSIEFARNGYLSIFMTPSVAREGSISSIVPMVSHVDHTEHEVSVIVTEQGLADLRGLDPRERATQIIENCAHPDYKPLLWDYFREAEAKGGHEPHILSKAFDFHLRLMEKGTMKI